MSHLTEIEIFDCLSTNFKLAANNCIKLAVDPLKGRPYRELRSQLQLIEGACRQTANWRGDTRWLQIGMRCAQALELSKNWIIKYRFDTAFLHKLFTKLSEFLAFGYKLSEDLRTKKTSTMGPVLPSYMNKTNSMPSNSTKMRISSGGIIIPEGANP